MKVTNKQLKWQAIEGSLFPATTLRRAIERLGFVQADPIRAPARAQDLILRHRVRNYQAGDLERLYPSLDVEEDVLYAYGFVPRVTWQLLHPRLGGRLSSLEKQVLAIVNSHQQVHPRELEAHLGRKREVNAWGGYSKSTTRVLERLHYRGLLRIARRENGVRLYEAASRQFEEATPEERVRGLILLIARILAPVPERSLRTTVLLASHTAPGLNAARIEIAKLVDAGELAQATVDGIQYVWPADAAVGSRPAARVRFLAPFDPVVWDRRRFEHFWGWAYRFEAYTPVAKRKLGYYAMPLLWGAEVIGWVNVSVQEGDVRVEPGFVAGEPKTAAFRNEMEAEVERFRRFLMGRRSNG